MSLNEVLQGQAQSMLPKTTSTSTVETKDNLLSQVSPRTVLITNLSTKLNKSNTPIKSSTVDSSVPKETIKPITPVSTPNSTSFNDPFAPIIVSNRIEPIDQFKADNPNVIVPIGAAGSYDVVRVTTKKYPVVKSDMIDPLARILGYSSARTQTQYEFSYSPKAIHKIEVAGSTDFYEPYLDIVRSHPELAALHLFSGSLNIDLALASNKPGITGASEREEILIKHLHKWKGSPESKGDVGRMWTVAIPENPFVKIALAVGGGNLLGRGMGAAQGYLTQIGRFGALKALNLGTGAAMTGITALEGYDISKKAYEGRTSEAVSQGLMFGLTMGAGWEGVKAGQGPGFRYGAQKGFEKNLKTSLGKNITWDEYSTLLSTSKARYNTEKLLNKLGSTKQTLGELEDVGTLKNQPEAVVYLEGKIPSTKDSKVLGSYARNKPGARDIDIQLSAKDTVFYDKSLSKITGGDQVADIHRLQKPGEIVSEFGTTAQNPYIYKTKFGKIKTTKYTEEFGRLSSSSLRPAHEGRLKDIDESLRTLDMITSGKKLSPKLQDNIDIYKTGMERIKLWGEEHPLIRSKVESDFLYGGKSLKDLVYEKKVSFWDKNISEKDILKDISKYTELGRKTRGSAKNNLSSSINQDLVSSNLLGGLSSEFFNVSPSLSNSRSLAAISKSISLSDSFDVSPSLSRNNSNSLVGSGKSKSSSVSLSSYFDDVSSSLTSVGKSNSVISDSFGKGSSGRGSSSKGGSSSRGGSSSGGSSTGGGSTPWGGSDDSSIFIYDGSSSKKSTSSSFSSIWSPAIDLDFGGFEGDPRSLLSPYGRTRKYKTGNLNKALNDFEKMFR